MDELFEIQKNLARMPKGVVDLILFYTYNCQPKRLLYDIENINIVKKVLSKKYLEYWADDENNNDWIINDIFSCANEHYAMMYGYRDNFYNIFLRHVSLKNRLQVNKYIRQIWKLDVVSQINIVLGLMTPEERHTVVTTEFW